MIIIQELEVTIPKPVKNLLMIRIKLHLIQDNPIQITPHKPRVLILRVIGTIIDMIITIGIAMVIRMSKIKARGIQILNTIKERITGIIEDNRATIGMAKNPRNRTVIMERITMAHLNNRRKLDSCQSIQAQLEIFRIQFHKVEINHRYQKEFAKQRLMNSPKIIFLRI